MRSGVDRRRMEIPESKLRVDLPQTPRLVISIDTHLKHHTYTPIPTPCNYTEYISYQLFIYYLLFTAKDQAPPLPTSFATASFDPPPYPEAHYKPEYAG